ncbi:MAG: hypothetical protein NVSMB18_11490 [Acetobacteraceae bacterium]
MLLLAGLAMTGCASSSSLLVDRMNVDDGRYNRDLAACKEGSPISLSFSNRVASCMSAKGYKVLMGR